MSEGGHTVYTPPDFGPSYFTPSPPIFDPHITNPPRPPPLISDLSVFLKLGNLFSPRLCKKCHKTYSWLEIMNLGQWEFFKTLKNNQNGKIIECRDFITFLIWTIVTIFYTIVDPTWIYAPANTPFSVIFTTKSRGITFYCKLVRQNMLSN